MSNKEHKCKEHGAKKEVMCKQCHGIFCPRCIVVHLLSKHKIDYLTHIDNAVDIIKEQMQTKIRKFKDMRTMLLNEKRNIMKKVAILDDNSELDALYKEMMCKLQKEIADSKKNKAGLAKSLKDIIRKLDKCELKYESNISNYSRKLNEIESSGLNIEENVVSYDADDSEIKAGDSQSLIRQINEIKYVEIKDISKDQYLEKVKKDALEIIKKSISDAVKYQDEKVVSSSISKKLKKIQQYKEVIAKTENDIITLKKKAEEISLYQQQVREKAEVAQKVAEESKMCFDQMSEKKFSRCDNCKSILCSQCTNNNCNACKKILCDECSDKCNHCNNHSCIKCIKPCLECNGKACSICMKDPSACLNSSIISIGEAEHIYTHCNTINSLRSLCYFDVKSKKLINLALLFLNTPI